MNTQIEIKPGRWASALGVPSIILIVVLMTLQLSAQAVSQQITNGGGALLPQSSFLFRFDPASHTFYTYTLPFGSVPLGVVVAGTNPTHIWVAESDRDRIGHLVFTDTNNFAWIEYAVTSTAPSGPFRITLDGNNVWFTERSANRIGRLNATTGQIDEFYGNGLSPNAGLADIKVSPGGSVWIAGQLSNQLIRLVVTSTTSYAFYAYTDTRLIGPYALGLEADSYVWFTLPGAHTMGRFTPAYGLFDWPKALPAGGRPTEIVMTSDIAWYSDPQLNDLGEVQLGTNTLLNVYGPIDRPVGLAGGGANPSVLWMTQQNDQGALGRLVYTSPASIQLDSFPLPTQGLFPTGIAVASDQSVWLAAYMPFRVYLPMIVKN